jgi:hypothetical protein
MGEADDPATSSPAGADTQAFAGSPTVSRGDFAPAASAPSAALAVRTFGVLKPAEEAGEVTNVKSHFSAESFKRTEIFRMRGGVQK